MLDISGIRSRLAAFLGHSHGGRRNLYEVFGYDTDPTPLDLYGLYLRNSIASRIVRAFPQATWREPPVIRDEKGDSAEPGESFSPFVEAVEDLFDTFKIYHYLERADRLASIGRYGLLVLGFQDGKAPNQPLEKGDHKLLYLSPYAETQINVAQWDTDTQSPRFGLPTLYNVQTGNMMGALGPSKPMQVHWSRTIHISEFLDDNEVIGVPRLLPIFNNLKDLEKVVGGSAESFWLNANRGLALWADKDANLSPEDIKTMKKQSEEFEHQLRRSLVGAGMTAQVLGSDPPDPKPNVETLLDLIAGGCGVPKRILIGSERGELSSAQDENNWSARIDERRKHYAAPSILRALVNMLIMTKNLPEPKGAWWTDWDETDIQSPADAATIAASKATALATYANAPDAQYIVPVQEFRRDFLGLPPESEYEALEEPEPLPEEEPVAEEPLEADDELLGLNTNAKPRSLYVCRHVTNANKILTWARKQGFKNLVAAEDLHVTIARTEALVDWMKIPGAWARVDDEEGEGGIVIPRGGARIVEPLGSEGAIVLLFQSQELQWRHEEFGRAGVAWAFDEYQPHITLTYGDAGLDLTKVKPFDGQIILGHEVFTEVEANQ